MMNFHKKSHEVPGLNTSSLPDLIFSVLFFFMTVTHMRQVTLKVDCRLPQGKELTRLTKKSAVSHIYICPQLYSIFSFWCEKEPVAEPFYSATGFLFYVICARIS